MVLSLLTGELLSNGGLGVTATTLLTAVPIGAVAVWVVLTGRLGRGRPGVPRSPGYAYR